MSTKKTYLEKTMAASKDKKVAELKAAHVNQGARESASLAIVESLIESSATAGQLLTSCRFINQAQYQDVVQERALIMNCGYPLCPEKIVSIPKKKYHISLKYNKVFDISDRKNFCSNLCFKASKHLESQLESCNFLPNAQGSGTVSKITLLTIDEEKKQSKGSEAVVGQETPLSDPPIKLEIDNKTVDPIIDVLVNKELKSLTLESSGSGDDGPSLKRKITPLTVNTKHNKTVSNTPERRTPLFLVEKCLKEWFTVDSAKFLVGQGDAVVTDDERLAHPSTKRAFDIDEEDYEAKVQSFYSGRFETTPIQKVEDIKETNTEDSEKKPVMPLVDTQSQNAFRRRIVFERLNLVSTELFQAMGIDSSEVKKEIRQLVHTFQLKATNISLKPAEWSVVAVVLLQLLTVRNSTVRDAFASSSSTKFLNILLNCFGQDVGYPERTRAWLMDIK